MNQTFGSALQGFSVKIQRMERDVFVGVTEEVQRSVVEGSEITASPGQPVDTGALRASWTPQFVSQEEWQTTTHLNYATSVEDGVSYAHGGSPLVIRSEVGGSFSVRATRVGFSRIVEFVAARLRGKNGA